ncbi:MAG: ZPR1-type zinc finger protein [Desulfurococcaceae archaeon]|nr:ZPR1-type zinc finger protein [Desulfurococcaceae archaeon]
MPKREGRTRSNVCPKCGTPVEPGKTWQLVSPLPDSQGRVTITIMGSFECPNCGYKWRGVVSKMKVGEDVEIEGLEKKEPKRKQIPSKPKQGVVIELDLEDISSEEG